MTFAEGYPPKVVIVVLTWNNYDDTKACIESLKGITYPNCSIVVVDNHSTDGSAEKLKQTAGIHLLQNDANLGFAAGNNVGIEFAMQGKADYILLLNNDTIVDAGFLTALVNDASEHKSAGVLGSKIYYFNDRRKIWSAGGGISKLTKRTFQYGENKIDHGQFDVTREVGFVSGCCMLIKREVVEKIGALDPDYFMYYEDVDFCLRARQAGFSVLFVPDSVIWHKVSAATNRAFRDYYRMRNYFLFLKRNYHQYLFVSYFFGTLILFERLGRILMRKLIFHDHEKIFSRVKSLVIGWCDGIKKFI